MITDEMVEKARLARMQAMERDEDQMCAAIEAIAPAMIAQGMREAMQQIEQLQISPFAKREASQVIRARIQELDPPQPGDPTNPFQRRNIGPSGPDPFGGRFR